MACLGDLGGIFVHAGGSDIGHRAVAAVNGAGFDGGHHFRERHGLTGNAGFLRKVCVKRNVGHAHLQPLDVVNALYRILGVEMTETKRKDIHGAHAGLFVKAVGDQLESIALHGAVGVVQVFI